jgi:dolichol-phosphate mannosyltransferase
MKLSVLMPVFNERATLSEILRRVQAVPVDKEIIVIDNCSTDGTREDLEAMLERGEAETEHGDGRLRIVLQPQNRGKGASVRRALSLARGEYVIVQDADLEYDPRDYLKLLAVAEKPVKGRAGRSRGRDAVFGTRLMPGTAARLGQPHTAFYYGRIGLSLLFRLLYASSLSDVATCYKLMRRDVAQSLRLCGSGFDLDFEIPARLRRWGVHIAEVPISYQPRTELEGKKIRAVHDGLRAAWTLVKYRFVR